MGHYISVKDIKPHYMRALLFKNSQFWPVLIKIRETWDKKNDSCFVEQKNYSVVRRNVGYLRYDTEEELNLLNELYIHLDHYTNYFQPVVKLVLKTRVGSKVTKKYDEARTPFRRVLECQYIDDKIKVKLKRQYDILNPAELKRKISRLQDRLLKLNTLKQKVRRDDTLDEKSYGYIYT